MKREVLSDAVGMIEYELIEEYTEMKNKFERRKRKMKSLLKYVTAAACLAIVVCVGAIAFPMLDNKDDGGDLDDVYYAMYFGGFLYEPIAVGDHSSYPAVKELMVGATSENRYDIREEHLGEYMGVFPGVESLGIPEGKAYHFAAYPDYDAVIIVERGGKYGFYISEGNAFDESVKGDSDSVFAHHGLPESVTELYTGHFEVRLNSETADEIFACLDGKESADKSSIERSKYDAWCSLYGEAGVHFDGKGFSYDNEEKYWEFTNFVNSDLHSLWIKTDKGFQNLLILIDLKFNYYTFCGNSYLLTEEECETLSQLVTPEQ